MHRSLVVVSVFFAAAVARAQEDVPRSPLQAADLFQLEAALDPRISPDGRSVVYARHSANDKDDRWHDELWIVDVATGEQRPLTSGARNDGLARWSPDGKRLAYLAVDDGGLQIWVRWMDTAQTARVTNVEQAPQDLAWSPDGRMLAFTAFVEEPGEPFVAMPKAPEGAQWSPPAKVITQMKFRADGAGFLRQGHAQLFVVPADGGTPRPLTSGPFDVRGPLAWTPDGATILMASNRRADAELDPNDTEIYAVSVADGELRAITNRRGPDLSPTVSQDGKLVAWLGFDDRYQGYQVTRLRYAPIDGGNPTEIATTLDRDLADPAFSPDGKSLVCLCDDRGDTKIARVTLGGDVTFVASSVGGMDFGRPYGAGSFTVANDGTITFTLTSPQHPADVAVVAPGSNVVKRLTALNDDVFAQRALADVEAFTVKSSFDQREIGAWLVTPAGFDKTKQYPLILEIHGGPFANYGPRFSYEFQTYAAEGYCVLYTNPRGSTSYGEEFGNLIHHAYPGNDYDDLMSCVDAVLARGFIDAKRLYVTGGSGGGCLTAWIVGKTDRFAAAVAAKPVIDWISHSLTADDYPFFVKYWFPAPPWEIPDHYFKRSPLSLVGNVKTPTMLITGEQDWRTPISQAEEYYQALKLRGVEAALVRIPESSHALANRPSQLISKVLHVAKWFEKHGGATANR